jgi:tetratricopeptide (TPR) repeat protein
MNRSLPMLAMLVLLPLTAFGQTNSSWIGKRVIIHDGAVLKVGNRVVDDENRNTNLAVSGKTRSIFRAYRVGQVNGDWLWLKAEKVGVEGWVKVESVIPFEQATDYFTNQIRTNPTEATWYGLRGSVWSGKKEYDKAIADYSEAIRLDPKDASAFINRGTVWSYKQEYGNAIADYSEAIRLDPKNATAYLDRGGEWKQKNDDEKAIADFSEAIRLNPKDATAYLVRGNVWSYKKEYGKAIADFSEAIRLDPKHQWAIFNRGWAWFTKKEYEKAIADFNEAIRLDPKDATAFYLRGLAWSHKKKYDEAIADYSEVIHLDSKFALAYSSRAWLRATCPDEKYRDGQKAFADASQACQIDDFQDGSIIDALAAAYAECGDFDKAVEWEKKANKLYTDAKDRKNGENRIKLYKDKKAYRDAG